MNAHVAAYFCAWAAVQLRAANGAPLALRTARIHNAAAALRLADVEAGHA